MSLSVNTQNSGAETVNGTQLNRADLLSLLDDFSHAVRTPLTVISEFASMLTEGILTEEHERDRACGLICEKTAETLLLVDVLDVLIRVGCGSVEVRREACEVSRVLEEAARRLDAFDPFRTAAVRSPADTSAPKIRCDPALAAGCMVHSWIWMRHAVSRDVAIGLELHPAPSMQGIVIAAAREDRPIDGDAVAEMACPLMGEGLRREGGAARSDLTLRVACELGRLAGGGVFMVGDRRALGLYVPSAD